MKITVITVVLNCANTIALTLESVKKQDFDNVEHVVIDGGSTDGTIDIVRSMGVAHLTSEPDDGIYKAMEKGVKMALGDAIIFLNSGDTFYSESTCREVANYFEKTKADIVFGDFLPYLIDESHSFDHPHFEPNRVCTNCSVVNRGCLKYRNIHHQALFYSRRVFDQCSFFVDEFPSGSDYILNVQAMVGKGFNAKYFPRTVSKFALGGVSTSSFDKESEQLERLIAYIERVFFVATLSYKHDEYIFNPFSEAHLIGNNSCNIDIAIAPMISEFRQRTDDIYLLLHRQNIELKKELVEIKKLLKAVNQGHEHHH